MKTDKILFENARRLILHPDLIDAKGNLLDSKNLEHKIAQLKQINIPKEFKEGKELKDESKLHRSSALEIFEFFNEILNHYQIKIDFVNQHHLDVIKHFNAESWRNYKAIHRNFTNQLLIDSLDHLLHDLFDERELEPARFLKMKEQARREAKLDSHYTAQLPLGHVQTHIDAQIIPQLIYTIETLGEPYIAYSEIEKSFPDHAFFEEFLPSSPHAHDFVRTFFLLTESYHNYQNSHDLTHKNKLVITLSLGIASLAIAVAAVVTGGLGVVIAGIIISLCVIAYSYYHYSHCKKALKTVTHRERERYIAEFLNSKNNNHRFYQPIYKIQNEINSLQLHNPSNTARLTELQKQRDEELSIRSDSTLVEELNKGWKIHVNTNQTIHFLTEQVNHARKNLKYDIAGSVILLLLCLGSIFSLVAYIGYVGLGGKRLYDGRKSVNAKSFIAKRERLSFFSSKKKNAYWSLTPPPKTLANGLSS